MERYSFSGKGNILIKAVAAGKYGGSSYAANEPIAYFTNVYMNLNFQYMEKTPRVGIDNLTVDPTSSVSYLQVSNIKISESLQSLLYKKKNNQKGSKTIIKYLTSDADGVIFLPIQSGETIKSNIFIYDADKVRITNFNLDTNTGKIINLNPNIIYTVFYSIDKNADATYSLESPQFPNLAVELQILGNLNGKTGEAIINLGSLKLLTRPSLDMDSDTPFVDNLDFLILAGSSAEVNYYAN